MNPNKLDVISSNQPNQDFSI